MHPLCDWDAESIPEALRTDGEDASTEQGKTSNSVRSCAHCASFPSTVYASDQMRSTRCKKGAARTSCNMRTSAATDDASSPAKCRVCASCRKRPEMVSNPQLRLRRRRRRGRRRLCETHSLARLAARLARLPFGAGRRRRRWRRGRRRRRFRGGQR
ncbi:hypothetical protein DIPPA_57400 [Diplonema papillatum]|nr:hypothetical protein DIPPA_59256 [Diplonema papillatum]KAJ9458419.1 hypothetical protein DIPPA_57400 [Diplonema papillatum]